MACCRKSKKAGLPIQRSSPWVAAQAPARRTVTNDRKRIPKSSDRVPVHKDPRVPRPPKGESR